MISFLITLLLSSAFAADTQTTQTTQTGGQEDVNSIGSLYAGQKALEARLTAFESRPGVGFSDADKQRITDLEAALATLGDQIAGMSETDATHAEDIAALEAAVSGLESRLVALETAEEEEVLVEVRTSGFHPTIGVQPTMIVGKPLLGDTGAIGFRLDFDARLVWDISATNVVGIRMQGGPGMGGWSLRGGPAFVHFAQTMGWGVVGGAAYNCDGFISDAGCMAERTGGWFGGTFEKGWGAMNLNVLVGGEVNYVTIPGASGVEFRGFASIGGSFGVVRPETVAISE